MKKKHHMLLLCTQFAFGGGIYGLLELAWRGFTHISMIILGGICFLALLKISKMRINLLLGCVLGGGFITLAELATGCVVNLWLGLGVWDYGEEAYHLLGQVCPRFTVLWCVLCAVILPVCKHLRAAGPALLHALETARNRVKTRVREKSALPQK